MPKIILKHKSPEYADTTEKVQEHFCEMPGCSATADHKAPKHRGLNEYYRFCFNHVQEYNKAWDFFSGMAESEVHEHMTSSMYGDRPTWRYAGESTAEDILRAATQEAYGDTKHKQKEESKKRFNGNMNIPSGTPEFEAMVIMGLAPPMTLAEIKTRYKLLAKKHHPDLNGGCAKSEELLKRINMAYTILKLAYEEFGKLPERN